MKPLNSDIWDPPLPVSSLEVWQRVFGLVQISSYLAKKKVVLSLYKISGLTSYFRSSSIYIDSRTYGLKQARLILGVEFSP